MTKDEMSDKNYDDLLKSQTSPNLANQKERKY
jgi:hypothetical protein